MRILIPLLLLGTSVCFSNDDLEQTFPKKENHFLGVGPALQFANGSFSGPKILGGVAVRFAEENPFVVDFSLMHPFFHEQIQGKYSGLISRWYGFLGMKYFFNENWYAAIRLGLGTIHNSNPSQPFSAKIVYGASVGRKVWVLDQSKTMWIDFSYDYMPTVRFNSVLSSWFCATGNPIGGDPKDCETQSIPYSHIFSVNGVLTFDVK